MQEPEGAGSLFNHCQHGVDVCRRAFPTSTCCRICFPQQTSVLSLPRHWLGFVYVCCIAQLVNNSNIKFDPTSPATFCFVCMCLPAAIAEAVTIRYDIVYLTCSKKLTCSQLSPPHGTNRKLKKKTN